MAYTTIDDPSAYFQTAIYTGDGNNNRAITNDGNSDLQPDFIWLKDRNVGFGYRLTDSTRGITKNLASETDGAESTSTTQYASWNTDGFTLIYGGQQVPNYNGHTYVAWQWKANGGTTATNTSGSINSTVQANTDAGFSIVSFTGNGTDGATVGHGLGAVPAMVIFKCRDTSNTDWRTYHQSISPTNAVSLNSTGAQYGASGVFGGTFTSTLLKVENDTGANRNTSPMIAYCFAEKQGYSKFGKYFGSGGTGITAPFVYTGFKPAFVLFKNSSNAGENWIMYDNKRDPHNEATLELFPNLVNVEYTGNAFDIDMLSNGFKHRGANTGSNGSSRTYIYMAFAENPFTTSTGIPTTAR